MNPLDDLFSKDGWIITKNIDGKTKVTSCNSDETKNFSETRNNWITFHENAQFAENQDNDQNKPERILKPPFQKIASKNNSRRIGFYLIRDLLNFKKLNGLSEALLADNLPLNKVMVCARISSYELKNNFYRLTLDDGTSSILCIIRDNADHLQDTCCEEKIETPHYRTETVDHNSSVLWVIKKLTLQNKKFVEETSINFNQMSLGRPVRIIGYLREYCGKNFINVYKFRWVSENYFVNCLSSVIQSYEYKENHMFKEENL